jgi:hypothetical protein
MSIDFKMSNVFIYVMIINADSKLAKIHLNPLNGLTGGTKEANCYSGTKMKERQNGGTCDRTQSISEEN